MKQKKRIGKLLGIFGLLVLMSVGIGCETDPSENPVEDGTIYAVGYGIDSSDTRYAYTWEDGVITELQNTVHPGGDASANAVYVSGDDVYIAGSCDNSSSVAIPGYWKNGVWTSLPVESSYSAYDARAFGVWEYNGSVYVSGFLTKSDDWYDSVPGYWVDGVWHGLTVTDMDYGFAYSIVVDSGDIYISGNITDTSNDQYAVYWKNGTPLKDSSSTAISNLNGGVTLAVKDPKVFVPGYSFDSSNRYMAGYMNETGTWNSLTELSETSFSEARGVHVQDGHVYMTGFCLVSAVSIPVYWKDGGSPVAVSAEAGYPAYVYEENDTIYVVGKKDTEFGVWKDVGGAGTDLSWIAYEMPETTVTFVGMSGAFYRP